MPAADTTHAATPFYQWDTTVPYTVEQSCEVNTGIPLDSIFPPVDRPEPQQRQSLFTHHGMAVQHEQPLTRHNDAAPMWTFGLLMMLTVLTYMYYRTHKIKFGELIKATIDHHATDRLVRSCNMGRIAALVPVGFLTAAVLAAAVFHAAMVQTGIAVYLLLAAALTVAYLLRNAVMRLLGNVFDSSEPMSYYITNNYLYHLVLSTFVLPLLFLQVYLPWGNIVVLYVIVAIAFTIFVLRLLRGAKIFLTFSKGHCFYLFYYLCIVEIVPFLVLVKMLFE